MWWAPRFCRAGWWRWTFTSPWLGYAERPAQFAPAVVTTMGASPSSGVLRACLLEKFSAKRLAPVRHRLDFVFLQEDFGLLLHVGHEIGRPSRLYFNARQCFRKGIFRHLESF